jgi:hypothetical protein
MNTIVLDAETGHSVYGSTTGTVLDLRLFAHDDWPQATFFLDTSTGLLLVSVPQFLGYRVIPWLAEGMDVRVAGRVRRDFEDGPMFIRARAMRRR